MTSEHDEFHAPTSADPWWTETCWFSFGDARYDLSGTFYPLFRRNLGVAALSVAVWDARAHETLEPLRRYRVRYRDAERLDVDLHYEALIPPHELGIQGGHGHLDQPCRFEGAVTLHGVRREVAGFDMRDRSWQLRADDRSTRGSYSYGIAGARDAFLTFAFRSGGEERVVAGFLLQGGEKSDLVAGTRRVARAAGGWPSEGEIEARDARGRALRVRGVTRNRLAHQASPGLFAWMSFTGWDFAGGYFGQDQDIWSPDALARP